MKAKHLLLPLLALALGSCSTVKRTSASAEIENTVVTFTVADLEVQDRHVSLTHSWSYNPFKPVSVGNVKGNVTAELIRQSNADVLLDPQYVVVKRGWLRGGSVTVTGIPASYKNFHKMTPAEAAMAREALDRKDHKKKARKRWFF